MDLFGCDGRRGWGLLSLSHLVSTNPCLLITPFVVLRPIQIRIRTMDNLHNVNYLLSCSHS